MVGVTNTSKAYYGISIAMVTISLFLYLSVFVSMSRDKKGRPQALPANNDDVFGRARFGFDTPKGSESYSGRRIFSISFLIMGIIFSMVSVYDAQGKNIDSGLINETVVLFITVVALFFVYIRDRYSGCRHFMINYSIIICWAVYIRMFTKYGVNILTGKEVRN